MPVHFTHCRVPGGDCPDGASHRWPPGRLCDSHGQLVCKFDRWVESGQFVIDTLTTSFASTPSATATVSGSGSTPLPAAVRPKLRSSTSVNAGFLSSFRVDPARTGTSGCVVLPGRSKATSLLTGLVIISGQGG